MSETTAISTEEVQEKDIVQFLLDLGIKPSLLGYHYALYGLQLMIKDPVEVIRRGMTKYVYPEIAKKFDTTPLRIPGNCEKI